MSDAIHPDRAFKSVPVGFHHHLQQPAPMPPTAEYSAVDADPDGFYGREAPSASRHPFAALAGSRRTTAYTLRGLARPMLDRAIALSETRRMVERVLRSLCPPEMQKAVRIDHIDAVEELLSPDPDNPEEVDQAVLAVLRGLDREIETARRLARAAQTAEEPRSGAYWEGEMRAAEAVAQAAGPPDAALARDLWFALVGLLNVLDDAGDRQADGPHAAARVAAGHAAAKAARLALLPADG